MAQRSQRVLVVDDDPNFREILFSCLRMAGYTVSVAGDGKEGLSQQRTQPVDLVVVDLFMPEVDGIEVVKELRIKYPDIKIIAMSGGGGVLTAAEVVGANQILHKPFEISLFLDMVESLLAERSEEADRIR